ncbi:MAG: GNAT family N-acetyltransferase [Methanobacteriaceae archaeon]|jgi:ribosomal protein S18 acetylase RimI-like enzyme|nr:GNAT family N-acetyltransferase [Methanobacteriaceae archaeon]
MIFEDFNPEIHDSYKIAILVYDVDFRIYNLFFKNKNKAVKVIEKELIAEFPKNNNYYKMKIILSDDNKILGVISYYTENKKELLNNIIGLFKNLGVIEAIKFLLIDILDSFVLADFKKGDVYISQLAINPSKRGQGLGSDVLEKCINNFRQEGFEKIILDVDFRNTKAKLLYEKIGFKEFNKKRFKILNFERGMYNMEFIL